MAVSVSKNVRKKKLRNKPEKRVTVLTKKKLDGVLSDKGASAEEEGWNPIRRILSATQRMLVLR